jgi:hypothetical protein
MERVSKLETKMNMVAYLGGATLTTLIALLATLLMRH